MGIGKNWKKKDNKKGMVVIMKVYHFVYTKFPKEETPWKKTDFHTVFYPLDLLTESEISELESRIHFPRSEIFDEKKTVFYYRIKGIYYLVIMYIKNLPDEKDSFGRGGIFLCHSFIFPPELWKNFPEPLKLFQYVEKYLFKNREEIITSQFVDRNTGNMNPIEIKEEILYEDYQKLPEIKSDFELKIITLLNKMGRKINDFPRIIFNGNLEKITSIMNKCIAFIPSQWKVNIGWDPFFDGGNFSFFPLKIVGYKDNPPIGGGENIKIDLEKEIILQENEKIIFFSPEIPFERWLNSCYKEAENLKSINNAFNLSSLLEDESFVFSEIPEIKDCFLSSNKEKIKEVFIKRSGNMIGREIAGYILPMLSYKDMLNLIIERFPLTKIAKYVEDVILKNYLTSKEVVRFPDVLRDKSNILTFIERVWNGEELKNDEIKKIDKKEEFLKYLIQTDFREKKWVLKILIENADLFEKFLSENETGKNIEKIILKLISEEKNFEGIEMILKNEIMMERKAIDLLKGKLDLMDIIENYIKNGRWSEKEIEKFLKWRKGKKPPDKRYKYIRAYLFPKDGIPDEFINDVRLSEELKEFLVKYYGYKSSNLADLGFKDEKKGSFLNLKKIFKKKGGKK